MFESEGLAFLKEHSVPDPNLKTLISLCDILLGPGDLAADLGLMREVGAPECWSDERFIAAEKKIADTANANGVIAGYWNGE